jgi:hypothetical protein
MSEAKTISAPGIHLEDESFDLKKLRSYHLSILSEERSLAFAVLDTNTNKYLVLHQASVSPDQQETGLTSLFSALGESSEFSSFKSVSHAVAHNKFTLVPSSLFDEANEESLLRFTHTLGMGDKIHSDTLHNLDAKNLFVVSPGIESQVRKHFTHARLMHSATSFNEGLLIQNKNSSGKKVFADFLSSYFEIALLNGRELVFNNAFKYNSPEDMAYYLLFVYEQLRLNTEEVPLRLSGAIEKIAKEHSLLYNYIRGVEFASLPESFTYSYKFEEVQPHRFFSLFNQYLCVS